MTTNLLADFAIVQAVAFISLVEALEAKGLLTKQDVKHRLDTNRSQIKDMSETVHSLLTIFSNYLTNSEARAQDFRASFELVPGHIDDSTPPDHSDGDD